MYVKLNKERLELMRESETLKAERSLSQQRDLERKLELKQLKQENNELQKQISSYCAVPSSAPCTPLDVPYHRRTTWNGSTGFSPLPCWRNSYKSQYEGRIDEAGNTKSELACEVDHPPLTGNPGEGHRRGGRVS